MKVRSAWRAWRAWRALTRVELRQLRRHPWRSLLVLLLVAVPVAAIVAGATLAHIVEPTADERRAALMGRADLRVDGLADHAAALRALDLLPAGSRAVSVFAGLERVGVPGLRLRARLWAMEPEALDPRGGTGLAAGMLRVIEGRAPRNSAEIALSPSLLEGLRRAPGDTVTSEYGPRRTITGVVVDPEDLELPLVLRVPAHVEHPAARSLLVRLSDADADAVADALRQAGFAVRTRADAATADPVMALFVFALGTIGLFEAALVISAAFAVGLRRRQVEIGLLGSTGATVGGVTASLLSSALALALAGAVAGAVAGIAGVAAVHPWLDGWRNRLNGPFQVAPAHVVGAVGLGLVAALLAALLPVRKAAGLGVLDALGGRRPALRRSRGWLVAGASLVLVGVTLLALAQGGRAWAVPGIVLGPVLGLLGFGACSPWLLDRLSRKAAPLPLTLRLAVRDSGRFRERNGAVVTAVLAGMSMSVTVAVLVFSLERAVDAFPAPLRDDQLRVEGPGADETARRIADALAAVAVAPLHAAYVHGEPLRARFDGRPSPRRGEWVAVGGDDLARALGLDDRDASPSRGALFALDPPEDGGPVQLTAWLDGAAVAGPAVKPVRTSRTVREPAFLLDADAAEHMGLTSGPPPSDGLVPWLVRLDAPVTVAQLERARSLAAESVRTSVDAALLRGSPFRPLYRAVLLVCGLTGLLVVVIATALSAAESAADERVLHTVGAAPRVLRSHLAARAGYLAWLGCVLAVPAGILAALALFEAANFPLPFVLPWRAMATVVLGLPGLVFVCTWCVGSPRGRGAGLAAPLTTLALLVGVPASAAAGPRAVVPPTVRWEPFTAVAFDGSPLPGERGFLELPEERSRPGEGTITLAFARYRSANPDPGPPIFFLAGGPGGPGIEGAATVATHPQLRLLEHADVIGIDQRGSGASRPSLASEELVETLPADRPLDRAALVAALRRAVARTVDHWKRQGVDLHAFDTEESADDLDAVRAALGLDSIVLYGASYGSHLGLAYLRRHGEHVARALLSRVEGPGDTWKLPATVQRQLERVDRLAAGDPRRGPDDPGLVERLALLLDRLDAAPVVVPGDPGTHDEPAVAVSALDLRISVARALDSVDTIAALPAWLARLERGDWNALAADAREHRRAGVHAMALMMDCASGAGAERRAALERQRRDERNLLGDAILAPFYLEACEAAGSPDLGDGFRAPFASDVPVLFVSGTLDVRTPPENVERLRHGFSTQAHVVVENAGHPPRELMSRDYRDLLQAFLRGEPVEDCRIALPEPVFESPE